MYAYLMNCHAGFRGDILSRLETRLKLIIVFYEQGTEKNFHSLMNY